MAQQDNAQDLADDHGRHQAPELPPVDMGPLAPAPTDGAGTIQQGQQGDHPGDRQHCRQGAGGHHGRAKTHQGENGVSSYQSQGGHHEGARGRPGGRIEPGEDGNQGRHGCSLSESRPLPTRLA